MIAQWNKAEDCQPEARAESYEVLGLDDHVNPVYRIITVNPDYDITVFRYRLAGFAHSRNFPCDYWAELPKPPRLQESESPHDPPISFADLDRYLAGKTARIFMDESGRTVRIDIEPETVTVDPDGIQASFGRVRKGILPTGGIRSSVGNGPGPFEAAGVEPEVRTEATDNDGGADCSGRARKPMTGEDWCNNWQRTCDGKACNNEGRDI